MKYKKEIINKYSVFTFEHRGKQYIIKLKGKGRRTISFEYLLKHHPKKMNIHDSEFSKLYNDTNKAMNEFINDEGFKGLVNKESKVNPNTSRKVDYYHLNLKKICDFLDEGGSFDNVVRRQPKVKIKKQLIEAQDGKCNFTGLKLFEKTKLKSKNQNFFITLLTLECDHRIPLFKGGSDNPDKIDNWQLISEYANKEKNKICKPCTEKIEGCKKCALAFPESNKTIKPSNQNLDELGFKPFQNF